MLSDAQLNYITIENEFLAVVFALDNTYWGLKQQSSQTIQPSGI